MTAADLHQLTGAYVLDSLDDLERVAFERHLTGCADCRLEVRELSQAVAEIGAADATPPPPQVRDAVLADVARTAQLPPHQPLPVRPPNRWLGVIAVAAAAVLAFGLGSWVTAERMAPVPTASDPIADVVRASDMKMAKMKLPDGGHSMVLLSPDRDEAALLVSGLAEPKPGRTYQVWTVSADQAATSGGTFRPDQAGTAEVMVHADLADVAAVAITEEPMGGSPQPTTDPIGVASLA